MKRLIGLILSLVLSIGLLSVGALAKGDLAVERESILSALYEADISSLRNAIDKGLISCEELTSYYLERISLYNKTYNCFITMCDDALDIARQRDEELARGTASGILFGIPVVIKDVRPSSLWIWQQE